MFSDTLNYHNSPVLSSQFRVSAYFRLLHASPNTPAVDIYANGRLLTRALAYGIFTEYAQLAPGTYTLGIFPSGQSMNPLLSTNITISDRTVTTLAITGQLPSISVFAAPDPILTVAPGNVLVRTIHLSPDSPPLDICFPCGKYQFENVGYQKNYRLYFFGCRCKNISG